MTLFKTNMGRRSFLKVSATAGGLSLGFNVFAAPHTLAADAVQAPSEWFEFNAVLSLHPGGDIEVRVANPDFGQNLMTSFPMIVAEELDANWEDIRAVQAPYNTKQFGMQISGGSWSVKNNWGGLRMAGATARHMLRTAAAETWGVPLAEVSTENSMLSHASGKRASYGDMAAKAAMLSLPKEVALKEKTDFKVIGSSRKNLVGPAIVQGDGLFGIDIRQEGMLRATVLHAPAFGMTLDTFDASDAKAMPGIKDIFAIKMYPDDYIRGFSDVAAFREVIAIVGDSTWQVLKAKKAVKATWKPQPAYRYKAKDFGGNINEVQVPSQLENSVDHEAAMQALIDGDMTQKRRDGNPESAFAKAAKVIERTYSAPFLAHNPLEPLNFYADVRSDSAKLVGPHQGSILIHQSVAAHLGMDPNQVEMIMTRMGGGFGRRLYLHFATEVALISQHVKRPVHLIYDREEDMTVGVYRPAYRIKMRAALDANNQLLAYHVRSAGVPEACSFPNRFPAGAVENFLWEEGEVASNITVGAFRAPHSNFMATAEQCFLDEIAEAAGEDPIEFRLQLLRRAADNPVGEKNDYDPARYAGVLTLAREKSGWDQRGNRAMGVAAYFCHNSYCCNIVEVAMENGEPNILNVTSALDCGIVVNHDSAVNMAQGGIVDGIGNAMFGEMTFVEGVPQKRNLDAYRMIRMLEAPKAIDVHFVPSQVDPTGLGEPPMPPAMPALANAIYRASGKRLYDQPYIKALNA